MSLEIMLSPRKIKKLIAKGAQVINPLESLEILNDADILKQLEVG
jgi:hypothetical protein